MGVEAFVALADDLAKELGALYAPTDKLREMAAAGKRFYDTQNQAPAQA